MRSEVKNLVDVGILPNSESEISTIQRWQDSIEKIKAPVTDEEAVALIQLFPPNDDDCFGLAWSLIHLVETAPNWPLTDCLNDRANPWIARLRDAADVN